MPSGLQDSPTAVPTAPDSQLDLPGVAEVGRKVSSETHAGYWLEICDSTTQLDTYLADWQTLARNAVEPNSFYEPWMLIPCLEEFHTSSSLQIVFVYHTNKRQTDPPVLCGMFPLEKVSGRFGRPARLRLLTNIYSYLSTPLLLPHEAAPAICCLLEWARRERIDWLDFPLTQAEGPFLQTLIDVLEPKRLRVETHARYNRAILRPATSFEAYQAGNLRGHNRRDMKRLRRRLEERGQLEVRQLETDGQLSLWIDQFLQLESQGWKGSEGTAVQNASHGQFFRQLLNRAWEANKLEMLGLFLNNEPIAMKCNFLAVPGSFAWKIAYDERYAKFSPGVQLELAYLERFHQQSDLKWMDSCAASSHSMINRLWTDRRAIQHALIPTGRRGSELLLAMRPLLKLIKKTWFEPGRTKCENNQ